MKNFLFTVMIAFALFISWAYAQISDENPQYLHFAVAAEYPPFEYNDHGELKGFDIDLARLVAKKLGKQAFFDGMEFSSILPAVTANRVDAAISTLTITNQRKKIIDFSTPYYFESMATVYHKNNPIRNVNQFANKKIAVQLGSTMEAWVKNTIPNANVVVLINNNQSIAALKAGEVDVVLMDGVQGAVLSQQTLDLSCNIISKSTNGYGLALPKGSALTKLINKALHELKQEGTLAKLEQKWFAK